MTTQPPKHSKSGQSKVSSDLCFDADRPCVDSDIAGTPRSWIDSVDTPITLHPADRAAVDTIIERHAQATGTLHAERSGIGPVPPGLGDRVAKATELLVLLNADGVRDEPVPGDLAARTMARIEAQTVRDEQRRRFAHQIDMLSDGTHGNGFFGLRQALGVAAVLLIGVSILLPTLERQRFDTQRLACMNNLGQVAQAFGAYAADYNETMPKRTVAAGDAWVSFMKNRFGGSSAPAATQTGSVVPSNSTNLHLLIDRGYTTPALLACPENGEASHQHRAGQTDWRNPDEVSYSYQDQSGSRAQRLVDSPRNGILADRTPLVRLVIDRDQRVAVLDMNMPQQAASRLHDGRGQNLLRADGTVKWTVEPMIDDAATSDNIWLPDNAMASPAPIAADSFLVP